MTVLSFDPVRLSALKAAQDHKFELVPDETTRAEIAARLELSALRKLSFRGSLTPEGKRDWRLTGQLGATVVQPCVVTLEPVTTRIDVPLTRLYLAHMPDLPDEEEVEMPEDDSVEPMPDQLLLAEVMEEALALNLPLYPRAAGADLGQAVFAEPGVAALTDEDTKPFAGLAALKNRLSGGDENDSD